MTTNLTRQDVTEAFTTRMTQGAGETDLADGFRLPGGSLKTYAIEAASIGGPLELLQRAAGATSAQVVGTRDDTISLLRAGSALFVVDTLDPRFWLLHTTSSARDSHRYLKALVWSQHQIDRCWFTSTFLLSLKRDGDSQWFKSDFEGRHMLPQEGGPARKLRIQLEGVNVDRLYKRLVELDEYRNATALTAIATRLQGVTGSVHELTHYSGRFVATGNSFHAHATFVAQAIAQYRRVVETVEATCGMGADELDGGYRLTGRPLTIRFDRPIVDMERFLGALFSCREPFRLWALPHEVAEGCWEAEVVDLHIGATFRMLVARTHVTVILPRTTCGNTALRLLTNLQHQFDARASWDLDGRSTAKAA